MAILNIGLPRTKDSFNAGLGALACDILNRMRDAVDAKAVMDSIPDQDLIDLGFTATEVTYMKTAVNELATAAATYLAADAQSGSFAKYLRGVIGS